MAVRGRHYLVHARPQVFVAAEEVRGPGLALRSTFAPHRVWMSGTRWFGGLIVCIVKADARHRHRQATLHKHLQNGREYKLRSSSQCCAESSGSSLICNHQCMKKKKRLFSEAEGVAAEAPKRRSWTDDCVFSGVVRTNCTILFVCYALWPQGF